MKKYTHEHARWEHAFLLRCEGLTLARIGVRLGGVSCTRARQLSLSGGRLLDKSMRRRRTKLSWKKGEA